MHPWFWCISQVLQSGSQWSRSRLHNEKWTYLNVCRWKNDIVWDSEVLYQIEACVPTIPYYLNTNLGKMCLGGCALFQLLTLYLFYHKGHHFSCCSWWDSFRLSRANTCVQPKSLSAFSHGGWQKGNVTFQLSLCNEMNIIQPTPKCKMSYHSAKPRIKIKI